MDEVGSWVATAAITELIVRYAVLCDAGQWDEVAALYADDARMSRPTAPDEFISGRDAILASFRARPPRAARHVVANVLVTLDSDIDARATSQILLFTGTTHGAGLPTLSTTPPLIGTYHDRLLRTNSGWRFTERRGSLDFRAP
jgi:hypothetical protein